MIEIQKQFLDKAIKQLDILGCKYAIQLPDGNVIGELLLAAPEPTKTRKKRGNYKHYGWKDKLTGLPVGEVAVFDAPVGMTLGQLQGLITGLAGHAWGNGNYTSTQCNEQIQIMRVG